jgi:predicted HNH restriction endonuclease
VLDRYPENWKALSGAVKEKARWKCEKCGSPHENKPGRRIQVHHLDYTPENCTASNLVALCPPCHLDKHKRQHGSVSPGQLSILELMAQA